MPKHSLQFIGKMKSLLEAEKAKLQQELGQTADFPEYGRDEEANAMEIADSTATQATKDTKETRLREIESALTRILEGTFGLTKEGKLIPENRLEANPAATTLIS